LIQRAKQSDVLAVECGFALSRFKGLASHIPPGELVKLTEQTRSKEAVAFLIRALSRVHTPAASALLLQKALPFVSQATRVEALKALSSHPRSKSILSSLGNALDATQTHTVFQSLDAIQGFGPDAKELSSTLLAMYRKSRSPWIRGKALKAGISIDPEAWLPLALKEVSDPKSEVRASAAGALALVPRETEAPLLATLLKESQSKLLLEILDSLSGWPEEAFTLEIKQSLRALLERKDAAISASVASIVERLKWKEFGTSLASAYSGLSKPDLVESKVALLAAMGSLGDPALTPILESALKDTERSVVVAAVDALRESSQKDLSSAIPPNSKAFPFPFSSSEVAAAGGTRVVLKTTRGEIQLRLFKETPLNAIQFLRLVRRKFYDGLTFHRIVPGFVVQGGDPRGDGFGGPGYLVRDEITPIPHTRGVVGLATSGKDTGGSQFFINLSPNYHLDGRYTAFAEVTKGIEVADRLEVGDKMLSVYVAP
jgi:cyclophilin family peptidyl-prolyl cis-trans isomerase/HEAT repeat protein